MNSTAKSKLKASVAILGASALLLVGGYASANTLGDKDKAAEKKQEKVVVKKQVFITSDKNSESSYEVFIDEDGNEVFRNSYQLHDGKNDWVKERKEEREKLEKTLAEIEASLKKLEKKKKTKELEYKALTMARDVIKDKLDNQKFIVRAPGHITWTSKDMGKRIRVEIEKALENVKERKEEIVILKKHLKEEMEDSQKELKKSLEKMHKELKEKDLEGKISKSVERSMLRAEKHKLDALERAEKRLEHEIARLKNHIKEMEAREKELAKNDKETKTLKKVEERKEQKAPKASKKPLINA